MRLPERGRSLCTKRFRLTDWHRLLPFWLPVVLQGFEGGGILVRSMVTTAIVAPIAILMGFGFPTGMRLATSVDSRPTPWFWGINGAGGVLGSVLAVTCSITFFGIATTITIGGLCYLALIPAAAQLGLLRIAPAHAGT